MMWQGEAAHKARRHMDGSMSYKKSLHGKGASASSSSLSVATPTTQQQQQPCEAKGLVDDSVEGREEGRQG
ncbi:UNVERIFIED_CONTAM: hypothetical protein K2H54_073814 [Gekko kuhli]